MNPLNDAKSTSKIKGEESASYVYPASLIENIQRSYENMNGNGYSRDQEYPGDQST